MATKDVNPGIWDAIESLLYELGDVERIVITDVCSEDGGEYPELPRGDLPDAWSARRGERQGGPCPARASHGKDAYANAETNLPPDRPHKKPKPKPKTKTKTKTKTKRKKS